MEMQAYYAMFLFSLISVAHAQETESSTKSSIFITPRIIGGSDVLPGTYPWFARGVVSYWGAFTFWTGCGGSLISENHVLTAGHCIDSTFRNIGAFQIGALKDLYINGWNGGHIEAWVPLLCTPIFLANHWITTLRLWSWKIHAVLIQWISTTEDSHQIMCTCKRICGQSVSWLLAFVVIAIKYDCLNLASAYFV